MARSLIVTAVLLPVFLLACTDTDDVDTSPEPGIAQVSEEPSFTRDVEDVSGFEVQEVELSVVKAEKTIYRGHIGADEELFRRLTRGDWGTFLEQAVAVVNTSQGFRIYDFDEREDGPRFQSLHVDGECGKTIGRFVSLPYRCVIRERWVTWSQILNFLEGEMIPERYLAMRSAVEDYLQSEGLI